MKNTLTVKGLVIAWIGMAALIGCTNTAFAQDINGNGNNGNALIVGTVATTYTCTPYLTAPIAFFANTIIGTLVGAVMPDKAETTNRLNIAAQVATNKALAEKLAANKAAMDRELAQELAADKIAANN